MSASQARTGEPVNTPRQVLFASLVGTTIEFFDFYIYATAAVLVFPKLFFPAATRRRHAGFSGHIRDCLPGAAHRVRIIRPLW